MEFIGMDTDFVACYLSFRYIDLDMPELPRVCIYDVKNMNLFKCVDCS